MSAPVELSWDGPVAGLSIDGPINQAWADAFVAAADQLAGARVVTIASRGRFFCAGGDLEEMRRSEDPAATVTELAATLHQGLLTLRAHDAPVIACVRGVAAGAGMSLVLAADIAIGTPEARFTTAYANVGFSPDGGMSWTLPRIVGERRATELLLSSRVVGAEEARDLGLLTELVEADAFDARIEELVKRLAAGPTGAYGSVRRLLEASATSSLSEQLALEAATIGARAATAEGQEGMDAFAAKRPPEFTQLPTNA
jgi:2-(1,2-epoxy-1,2-dihydrophenyl)acetyl-CoA isomerase